MVREIWFVKNGSSNLDFFSGSRKVVDQKKSTFFQVGEKWFCKLRFFFSCSRKVIDQKNKIKKIINP